MASQTFPSGPSAPSYFIERNPYYNVDYPNTPQKMDKYCKMKAILSQLFAMLPIFLLNFSGLSFFRFLYYSESAPRILNLYNITSVVGLLIGGIIAQIIGGRLPIMLGGMTLAISWLIFQWLSTAKLWVEVAAVVGLTTGMMRGPSYVYLAEIAQPKTRNALVAMVYLSMTLGIELCPFLLSSLPFTTFQWINFIIPVVGLVMMFFLPESPHWLANKERYHSAEKSLAWFRGWTSPINVESESRAIISHAKNHLYSFSSDFKRSLLSLVIVSYVFTIMVFCYINNPILNFNDIGKFDRYDNIRQILLYSYRISPIIFVLSVIIISKKTLILTSLCGGSISFASAFVSTILLRNEIISVDRFSLLYVICLISGVLFLNFGIVQSAFLLNAELFPSKLRYVGTGFGLFILYWLERCAIKIYLDYVVHMPINMWLLILASITFLGFLTLCWFFPRNENKTMVEIHETRS